MIEWIAIAAGACAVVGILAAIAYGPVRSALRASRYERARREFHRCRERLEAKFFQLAAASGKPRGLRWSSCDFEDDVSYARDRRSGELCAFVAVTIGFEAVEGGGMEHVEAVGSLRAATAEFRLRGVRWETEGRTIFNLNPTEAIDYYRDNLEIVAQETVGGRR
ncbi:MAG TPA: hypothetical protein VNH11_09010 [Pirellulales bacterium]|nr:hypothetical protein [Pirellulales bacterium]